VSKYYPYRVEVVDAATFDARVEALDTDYNYLIIENAPNLVMSIFDPEQMRTIYLDADALYSARNPSRIDLKFVSKANLKRLTKAIGD
jgi:hypothetical protein